MTYRKTWLSYLLWAVYTCAVGVMAANYTILFWRTEINGKLGYQTAVFVFAVFAGLGICYFLIRKTVHFVKTGEKRVENGVNSRKQTLWKTPVPHMAAAVLIFAGGLIYRVLLYLQSDISGVVLTEYYHQATIKAGEDVTAMAHGASYLYSLCLSLVFSFLGNKADAAVWMQIFIQMLTVLLSFVVVKKIAGSIPAYAVMAVFSFSSQYREHIFDMIPEDFFFLLYLVGLFIVVSYAAAYCRQNLSVREVIVRAVFVGISIGALVYLDAVSLTLLIFLAGLFTGSKRTRGDSFAVKIPAALFILVIASGGLTLMGLFSLDAYSGGFTVGQAVETWYKLYQTHLSADYVFYRTEQSMMGCFVLVLFAALLIPAFWNRRNVQNATPWICMMLILAPTPLTAIGVLSYEVYSIFVWSVLAGIGLQQSFVWEPLLVRKPVPAEGGNLVPALEPLLAVEGGCSIPMIENTAAASVSESEPVFQSPASEPAPAAQSSAPKPRFIENPLPLPKKHERREMGYQYDVAEDRMEFDLEIDENDDFDHA